MAEPSPKRAKRGGSGYVNLTTHPGRSGITPIAVKWGKLDPMERGPIIATNSNDGVRNAIGAHAGSYVIYRALAVASKTLDPEYRPDYTNCEPAFPVGPFPSWADVTKVGSMDPFGHNVYNDFKEYFDKGYDVRPSIAVTRAHIDVPEIKEALRLGRLKPDGAILNASGQCNIRKAAVEPVWYLPEIARRFGTDEATLRGALFKETNGMYPELLTRTDVHTFMPPIGGLTIYVFGEMSAITDDSKTLAVRVHDECNGSDVFGSDICTCRPYLIHAIEVCIQTAQEGGAGVIVYFRKEGRALGEVTKYLVYNARKRQEGGDRPEEYFNCTENVAGVQDSRFQALMPDPLHWLGITRIDKFISMSNMKYDAIVASGIEVVARVPIPVELIPDDAKVEIDAKVHAGYDGGDGVHKVTEADMAAASGREWTGHKKD